MNKKALRKDFFMEIRTSLGRFLSIFFIVAIGVAFFSGIRATEPDMRYSGDAYFDEKNLMDIQVISTLGLTDDDIEALEALDGVEKVEYGYSIDALCMANDSQQAVHILSILPTMNALTVEEGRLPKKADECVVDVDYLEGSGYKVGDEITFTSGTEDEITDFLAEDTFTIVGAASSPCYIAFHRGSTTIGTGSIAAFICVPEESFDMDVYTELYLSVKGAAELTEFTDAYTDRIEEVKEQVEGIRKKREDARYQDIIDEANEELEDARQELEDAKKEAQKELKDAEKKIKDGWTKWDDGKNQLDDSAVKLEDSRAQLISSQGEVDRSRAELERQNGLLNEKVAELNANVEEYNKQLGEFNRRSAEYEEGLKEYNQGLNEYNEGVRAYNQSLGEYNEQLAAFNGQKEQYYEKKDEYDAQKKLFDGQKQEYEQQKQLLEQGKAALDEGCRQLDGMKAQKAQLEALIEQNRPNGAVGTGAAYMAGTGDSTAGGSGTGSGDGSAGGSDPGSGDGTGGGSGGVDIAVLEQQLQQLNAGIASAEAELSAKSAELAAGQAQLDAAAPKLKEGEAQLDSGRKQLSSAWQQIEAAEEQFDAGRLQLEEARAQLMEARSELDSAWAQLSDGKAQLDNGRTQLNDAKVQLDNGQAQLNNAKNQIQSGRNQLASGQAQINDGWYQLWQGESEISDAKKELADKKKDLTDAEAEYEKAKAEAEEKIADGEKELRDAEDEISKIEHAKWYINDRSDLTEHAGYGENADRMRAIGQVFPVLFFLVAALISLTTMTRMVEEQRTQIGTLKALGYDRHSIAAKYLGYACLATVLGCVAGVLFGEKVFPYIIIVAYGIMYEHIPNVVTPYNLYYALTASAAALACTLLATIFSCYRELREQAAELMRPPTPKQGKRVLLERVPFIWNRLNFTWKATIRNLVRYKKRFFMTIFGIGGCMALLLVGFGLKDSIFDIGLLQYHELQIYDGDIILNEDASDEEKVSACEKLAADSRVEKTEVNLLKQVTIGHGKNKKDVFLNVPADVERFPEFVIHRDRITQETFTLDDEGVILSEKTAKQLEVSAGDTIFIKDDIKGEIEVPVSAVCENYMQHYLYMAPSVYQEAYGKAPDYNSIYFIMKEGKEKELEDVGEAVLKEKGALSASYTKDIEAQLNDMLVSLNIVMVVLVISAGMLAFVVLYNLNNINITERKRELATLKVLGFYPGEVAQYVYRENIILTVLGALAGSVLGKFLHQFVIVTVEIDSAMFGRNIDPSSFVYGFLITVGFSAFVNGVMYFKLKRIDMVESLKSVE